MAAPQCSFFSNTREGVQVHHSKRSELLLRSCQVSMMRCQEGCQVSMVCFQ